MLFISSVIGHFGNNAPSSPFIQPHFLYINFHVLDSQEIFFGSKAIPSCTHNLHGLKKCKGMLEIPMEFMQIPYSHRVQNGHHCLQGQLWGLFSTGNCIHLTPWRDPHCRTDHSQGLAEPGNDLRSSGMKSSHEGEQNGINAQGKVYTHTQEQNTWIFLHFESLKMVYFQKGSSMLPWIERNKSPFRTERKILTITCLKGCSIQHSKTTEASNHTKWCMQVCQQTFSLM